MARRTLPKLLAWKPRPSQKSRRLQPELRCLRTGLGYPVLPFRGSDSSVEASIRFTRFATVQPVSGNLVQAEQYSYSSLAVRDCQFWNGSAGAWPAAQNMTSQITMANNLFWRLLINFYDGGTSLLYGQFRNNTVFGGSYSEQTSLSGQWQVRDNLFHNWDWMDMTADHAFNAYVGNACVGTNQVFFVDLTANDVALTNAAAATNFTFASGPLGDFYQGSTNLVDRGSLADAGLAGLYHHTTRTNQTKEANTRLDIGFHYVACDASGLPLDSDGDGLPDYLEDANGNGSYDAADFSNWQAFSTSGDGVSDYLKWLQGGNARVSGVVPDAGGAVGLQLFTPLR